MGQEDMMEALLHNDTQAEEDKIAVAQEAQQLMNQLVRLPPEKMAQFQRDIEMAAQRGDRVALSNIGNDMRSAADEEAEDFHEKLGGGVMKMVKGMMAMGQLSSMDQMLAQYGLPPQHRSQGAAMSGGNYFTASMLPDASLPDLNRGNRVGYTQALPG